MPDNGFGSAGIDVRRLGLTDAPTAIGGSPGASLKVVYGQHTTVAAADTVVTGLATVVKVIVTLDSDPVTGAQTATATIGDQAGAPAAGSVILKTWKATATADTAVIAATTFGKKLNWIAIGT